MAEPEPRTTCLESFRWMADAAWRRFDGRRTYEWQANFSLWAAFGAIAAFLIHLPPAHGPARAIVVPILVGLVVIAYAVVWAPWLHSSNARDQRTAYYWESAVQHSLGVTAPPRIRPTQDWPRFPEGQSDLSAPATQVKEDGELKKDGNLKKNGKPSGYCLRLRAFYCAPDGIKDNPSAAAQLVLTVLVAVLPLLAVWCW